MLDVNPRFTYNACTLKKKILSEERFAIPARILIVACKIAVFRICWKIVIRRIYNNSILAISAGKFTYYQFLIKSVIDHLDGRHKETFLLD